MLWAVLASVNESKVQSKKKGGGGQDKTYKHFAARIDTTAMPKSGGEGALGISFSAILAAK